MQVTNLRARITCEFKREREKEIIKIIIKKKFNVWNNFSDKIWNYYIHDFN